MKHLITVMFIVIACGACLAWSQTPASPRASSGSSNQATANIKIETVPIQRIPRDAGKEMYASYCAGCHGMNAKGAGPAAQALSEPVPDLTLLSAQNGGRFPTRRVRLALSQFSESHHRGLTAMPDWHTAFRSLDRSCP